MRLRFRAQLFFAALATALLALVVAGILFAATTRTQIDAQIAQTLAAEARLAAELLRSTRAGTVPELNEEADRIGQLIGARVTFIAADGTV
ncbi:MAG TPA: hypothetical protein VG222_03805, partial [Vicinamibacterales bacterium]|nr:hypothetical protein [Vicinamibacterales bacterium]